MVSQKSVYSLKDSMGYHLALLSTEMTAEMRRRVSKYGITTQQCPVLIVLIRGQDLNVTHLADGIGVDFGGTSRMVDRLVAKGLVTSRPDGTDRRARRIKLSRKGRELAEKILAASWETNEQFLKRVTQKEAQQFREILDKLLGGREPSDQGATD